MSDPRTRVVERGYDATGFELLLDELGSMLEPEGEVAFHWVLGRT